MSKLQARSLLAILLVVICLALLVLGSTGALAPAKNVLYAPLAVIQRGLARAWSAVAGQFQPHPDETALLQRNAELESQNAALQAQVTQLQENQADYKVLSELLKFELARPDNQYLTANIIGRDPSPYLTYLILDRGSDQGIRRDMPVVTERGLVGRVVEVTSVACKVLPILDASSVVNARLLKSREEGVVNGQLAGGLEMQYLAQNVNIDLGETVVTSGLGGRYPADIVIGTVNAVQKQDYQVQQKADLTAAVDFSHLEIVLIITNFKPVDFTPFSQGTPTP